MCINHFPQTRPSETYHLWVEWSEESLWWAGMNWEVLPTITVFLTWNRVPDSGTAAGAVPEAGVIGAELSTAGYWR